MRGAWGRCWCCWRSAPRPPRRRPASRCPGAMAWRWAPWFWWCWCCGWPAATTNRRRSRW
ncbi:hypothetical protein HML84_10835 [Alcanivorax sp. IO_7]|nr:hypothetical protein HML84_10835 [Alcanivorax sp. IO_7]